MYLGVSTGFAHEGAKDWARKQLEIGGKAVVFPVNSSCEEKIIAEYADAAKESGLVIAEVGIWKNVLSKDAREREAAMEYSVKQLRLADEIGARCCVNITGTNAGPKWDGAYRENFGEKMWEESVKSIQTIIDAVNPKNTKFTIEPMPWMIPTGPDEYLELIRRVDREAFAVHMDLINMINCPQRYFFQEEFMEETFDKLHGLICSCHLKDVHLREEFTFQLQETTCGNGELNIEKYAELATREREDMPLLIEHIDTDEEYRASMSYVRKRLKV